MVRHASTVTAAVLLLVSSAAPAAAQNEAGSAMDDIVMVTAVEYAYQGLPASVPVGTRLGLVNSGVEVHEMQLYRIADDVTVSLDELLAMYLELGEDPEAAGLVEMIGGWPLYAQPGVVAEGAYALEREGRYAIICLIPQGLADIGLLEGLGPEVDPADLPQELRELLTNPPHAALGMSGEFTVTAPGTPPRPTPGIGAAPTDEASQVEAAEADG